jgi:hypothetical protein
MLDKGPIILDENGKPGPTLSDHITKLAGDLAAQVATVRDLRQMHSEMQAGIDERRADWEKENEKLLTSAAACKTTLAEEEAELRDLTLQAYHETGEKKPAPGVGIRITKSLSYDETAAKAWALKENPGFLVLDRPGFEAYAKVLLKMKRSIPGILLQEEERPQATISKEL